MMHSYKVVDDLNGDNFRVLILVVMDDALVPQRHNGNIQTRWVLILVVMDDALVPAKISASRNEKGSLNPCCNG